MDEFTTHACEQVLRFTQVAKWDDLSEERKVQLGFNMGVMSHGLELTKENGYQWLADAQEGTVTMQEYRAHLESLITDHEVLVKEENIAREF